jgi:hypothetical protein
MVMFRLLLCFAILLVTVARHGGNESTYKLPA